MTPPYPPKYIFSSLLAVKALLCLRFSATMLSIAPDAAEHLT